MSLIRKQQLTITNNGFTLIELLVVISIIGLLASIVLVNLNKARMKARDARRIADLKSVSLALQLYYDEYNQYPSSPNYCCRLNGDHNRNFIAVVQQLVDEGLISSIPEDPLNSGSNVYAAYKYGAGSVPGLIINAHLEAISPTTNAPFGSCRPFVGNWCSKTNASTMYCLCHPY